MFTKDYLQKLLIFDIETVSKYSTFNEFVEKEPKLADLWLDKAVKKNYYDKEPKDLIDIDNHVYNKYSCLHSEFSKVCSISLLKMKIDDDNVSTYKVKTLINKDEKELLIKFSEAVNTDENKKMTICGHNIGNFDIPFINKRLLINGLPLPSLLNFINKKPWEVNMLDTMTLWKFTGTDMISLDLLCTVMGVVSPKEEGISGTNVNELYYSDKFDIIKEYNERDVISLHDILIKLYLIS